MPLILGFTGTSRGMTQRQRATVRYLFSELMLRTLHHGICVGADVEAHREAEEIEAYIVGHPPTDQKSMFQGLKFDELRKPFGYLTRNRHIVAEGVDGLIAAPKDFVEPANLRGQGTWTTIGYRPQGGAEDLARVPGRDVQGGEPTVA
jgi:hypothetical protein